MDIGWCIELLGGLRIRRRQTEIAAIKSRKAIALLACLALSPHRPIPREVLLEELWPDEDPEATRNRLSQALTALRHALESDAESPLIQADRFEIRLDPARYTTDVREFDAALRAADRAVAPEERRRALEAAVGLYSGELLPGLYEPRLNQERIRLASAHAAALQKLMAVEEAAGDLAGAVSRARRLIALDPLCEEAHCHLIRLLGALGQTTQALRQFQELEELLHKELRLRPSPESCRLANALRAAPSTGPPSFAKSPANTHPVSRPERTPPATGPLPETLPAAAGAGQHDGIRTEPDRPALRLPAALTPFFGRETELARLRKMLAPRHACAGLPTDAEPADARLPHSAQQVRLVTLMGPGGAGKTRLAREAAQALSADYGDALWFVPLAELREAERLPGTIAESLSLQQTARTEPLELLTETFAERPCLLVLDNLEGIAEGAGSVVQALLHRAPELKCLVTSRQILNVEGEHAVEVAPLPTPAAAEPPERLLQYAGVQLFVDRAGAAQPDFTLNAQNADAVAALCRHLDGLPLALELAAAWTPFLTPAEMVARLSQRFTLLVSRKHREEPRHRSLWVAVEMSYQILPPHLRKLFARLGVFQGGWTLEAAVALCRSEETHRTAEELSEQEPPSMPPDLRLLENLADLRDRSLLISENSGPETRFRMLETLGAFAMEKLREETGAEMRLRQQHADYFERFTWEQLDRWRTADGPSAVRRLECEEENLRGALDWAVQQKDLALQMRLAHALGVSLRRRGRTREAVAPVESGIDAAVAAEECDTWRYAELLGERAVLCVEHFEWGEARRLAKSALAIYERQQNLHGMARAANNIARICKGEKDYAAARLYFQQAMEGFTILGDIPQIAIVRNNLGSLEIDDPRGDRQEALTHLCEALVLRTAQNDLPGVAETVNNLGRVHHDLGALEEAWNAYFEALQLEWRLRRTPQLAAACSNLGEVALARNNAAAACRLFVTAERLFTEVRSPWISYTAGLLQRAAQIQGSEAELPEMRRGVKELSLEALVRWATEGLEPGTPVRLEKPF